MNEKSQFFFEALDAHIRSDKSGPRALQYAAADYAHVFHIDDGRSQVARAAERALDVLNREQEDIENLWYINAAQTRDMLDKLIRYWRKKRDNIEAGYGDRFMAECYVDAYQSVRKNIFGETLAQEESDGNS